MEHTEHSTTGDAIGSAVKEAYSRNYEETQQSLRTAALDDLGDFDGTVGDMIDIIDSLNEVSDNQDVMSWPFTQFALSFPHVVEAAVAHHQPEPKRRVRTKAVEAKSVRAPSQKGGAKAKPNGRAKANGHAKASTDGAGRVRLAQVQADILMACGGKKNLTTSEIQGITGYNQRQVLNALSALQTENRVTKTGERRSTRWSVSQ